MLATRASMTERVENSLIVIASIAEQSSLAVP
jgi:hypothetical protein